MGSRNHEVVPTPLIAQIAHLRGGAGLVHSCISTLAKANLIARPKNGRYDGYRLTYGGLDHLALHAHTKARALGALGSQIGTGKESDVYLCTAPGEARSGRAGEGEKRVLKLHRLGRVSFRAVKNNRDYLRGRHAGSWMYMSRLAALKEHACMRALAEAGFSVPRPVAVNRHAVVMEWVDGTPLRMVEDLPDPPALYAELMDLVVRLAGVGLIHGDFNEFNIMIVEEDEAPPQQAEEPVAQDSTTANILKHRIVPVLIDFPQMVSTSHPNAQMYFDRDVACVKRFFARRFGFTSTEPGPSFNFAIEQAQSLGKARRHLDVEVEASGFSRKMAKELDGYMKQIGIDGDGEGAELGEDGEGEEDDEGEGKEDQSIREANETPSSRSSGSVRYGIGDASAEQDEKLHNLGLQDPKVKS